VLAARLPQPMWLLRIFERDLFTGGNEVFTGKRKSPLPGFFFDGLKR
jgi:hypothetical protein